MVRRVRLVEDDPIQQIADRLNEFGCTPQQVQRHIRLLIRPKPPRRFEHYSEDPARWLHQLMNRAPERRPEFHRVSHKNRWKLLMRV